MEILIKLLAIQYNAVIKLYLAFDYIFCEKVVSLINYLIGPDVFL